MTSPTLMSEPTIVFIQRGFPPFLKYCVAQAQACGYRTIVLGDEEVGAAVDCEFYNIADYFADASRFAERYIHIGSNSYDYELFCFQRWYALRELARQIGGEIYYVDSDVLVFPGLDYAKHLIGGKKLFNVPWINYFRSHEEISFYIDFVDSCYESEEKIRAISEKYLYHGIAQMSDMYLFYEIGSQYPDQVVNFKDFGHYLGFDNCVRDMVGYQTRHHHKIVNFRDGLPYCPRDVGGETRFFSLHFQGMSKPLMQLLHTISDPKALERLDDLTFWFDLPGHSAAPGYDVVKAAFDELSAASPSA